jgi:hypothetical protein
VKKIQDEFEIVKTRALASNAGIAFVSFKEKDHVLDTIDEIDIVKTKLVGKEHYDTLQIKNWEVEKAHLTNDIIWNEINEGRQTNVIIKWLLTLIPIVSSIVIVIGLVYVDSLTTTTNLIPIQASIALKYVSPMLLCVFTYYLIPKLIFFVMKLERFECKSQKEENFIYKNSLLMIFNSLILPIAVSAALSGDLELLTVQYPDHFHNLKGIVPQGAVALINVGNTLFNSKFDENFNLFVTNCIKSCQEFSFRYICQLLLLIILY